ncbi:phosphatidylinositol transfer protein alpha isoform-like [Diadema antillarum]|uniref:phosphatidylinositol transfer protein alpha isoform-like n=1 Tax=Diadema antillarum TaxID=105358 RepID=UPI003A85AB03
MTGVLPPDLQLNIASLYTVCAVSKAETGGGEGIEWVVRRETETDDGEPCLYTHKIIHMEKKVPGFIRMLLPSGAFTIHEKTTNCFPRCRTEYSNPGYMKDNYSTVVETISIADDRGEIDNVFDLGPEELSRREVVNIDIINDRIPNSVNKQTLPTRGLKTRNLYNYYRVRISDSGDFMESQFNTDPSKVTFQKVKRGPFGPHWQDTCTPVLCCYKLVKTEFKWFGLQEKIQAQIKKSMRRRYLRFHRLLYSYLDQCHGMTITDIRQLETETQQRLDEMRERNGMTSQQAH